MLRVSCLGRISDVFPEVQAYVNIVGQTEKEPDETFARWSNFGNWMLLSTVDVLGHERAPDVKSLLGNIIAT